MAAASSSSGGSFKYDVFINFRGEDTRRCFVCHLYEALKLKALDTFIDSEELRKGDDLSVLLKAIQESRLSIVVFSKNYASSTWCLKELVQILECMDRQSQIVVPVFYEVDPSHVRKLKESFAEAFAKHESDSNLDKEEFESWKSSLTRATNLSGYDSKNYQDDNKLIKSIVEEILEKLIRISPSSKTDGLIGMDYHMDKMDSLLQLGLDDCRIVGIWGMGGIGKSTIAIAVYDQISPQFEHKCFLDNVKEGFLTKNGAVQMVENLLCAILNVKDRRTLVGGLNMVRERLTKKKVLLVLDDVDALGQIETLIGQHPSFGGGSRIIITTRDKKLLAGFSVYEPKLFAADEALELFRRHAFRTIKFSESYDEISRRAVKYAHGLPLALKVLGAFLDNKTVQEWEYELNKIKKIPITFLDNKIGRVLWASFDGLDEWQKNIFLDIACFFRGEGKEEVTQFHESCGFFPQNGLRVLEERSLVTVSCGLIEMHDLIQEMGRDIVYRESTKDPGRRSRLWYYDDVLQVLAQNTPADAVEGLILKLSELKELCVNTETFVSMKRLRMIQIGGRRHTFRVTCKQHMSGELKFLSNELRILNWHGCPLKSLPSDFQPKNLTKIDMPYSHIVQLWEGTKPLRNLVYMNLSYSQYLVKIPDLTEATNLKNLNLEGCTSLLEVHSSISALKSLVQLKLHGCSNLEKFPNVSVKELTRLDLDGTAVTEIPSSVNDLPALQYLSLCNCRELRSLPSSIHIKSLEGLYLSGCSKLEEFPEISQVMERLGELDLEETAIKQLPSSIDNLTGLKELNMRSCTSLVSLPDEICNLASLENIVLNGCSKLEEFPEISAVMEKLSSLDLEKTAIRELPSSIDNLPGLKELYMGNCTSLISLPDEICNLARLKILNLKGCSKLEKLPDNFQNFKSLGEFGFGFLVGSGIKTLPFGIRHMKSLSCQGWEKLTAPFSSWPPCMRNPSSSIMVHLDLSDCNLQELSDAIAHLSSLKRLRLCRNKHLESLPAAMNRLPHLEMLHLQGCESLKSIPELPSSIQQIDADDCNLLELSDAIAHSSSLKILRLCRNKHLESLPAAMNRLPHLRELHLQGCESLKSIPELALSIKYITANNCTSLETVSTPQLPCVNTIRFTFLNCLKLESTNLFIDIVESGATNYQDFDYDHHTYMSLPASEIPDWFNHQCVGSSVTVQLPPDSFANQLQGFAVCAISNLRGANNRTTLRSAVCCVSFKEIDDQDDIYFSLFPIDHYMDGGNDMPIKSDHMFLGYRHSLDLGEWHNDRKYTKATFRIVTSDRPNLRNLWGKPFESITYSSNDPVIWEEDCTWITSCGVRLFQNAPSSVDLVCNLENREPETSSKRKRKTLERDEEVMGKECSRGPICCRFSLCGSTISLRKKRRESEAEGVSLLLRSLLKQSRGSLRKLKKKQKRIKAQLRNLDPSRSSMS